MATFTACHETLEEASPHSEFLEVSERSDRLPESMVVMGRLSVPLTTSDRRHFVDGYTAVL